MPLLLLPRESISLRTARNPTACVPAGEAISNSESIRRAHNSFSPPQAIVPEETQHPDEEGDAFHFICYIHRSGHVWELDGLKAGPIKLGACTEVCAQPSVVGPAIAMHVLGHWTVVLLAPSSWGPAQRWCRAHSLELQAEWLP